MKQITGSKEISKWLERKGTIKQQSIQEWTLNLNWSDKKVKTKNLLGCFEINSMFRTSVHGFLPDLSRAYIDGSSISRVKLYRNELRGNKNYFEIAGGSSYRGFELPRVKLQ